MLRWIHPWSSVFSNIVANYRGNCRSAQKIFASSLAMDEAPDIAVWQMLCLFKEGCKDKLENLRSVSLTSLEDKLLEGILGGRTFKHLERQGLIKVCQHDFVYGQLCLTNLILSFLDR